MFTAKRVGRGESPIPIDIAVSQELRSNYNHRIYWHKRRSVRSVWDYNTITTMFDKPCYRRWLEYKGHRVPTKARFFLRYDPPSIKPKPERYWILREGEYEIASYTNVVEAWFVLLGEKAFAGKSLNLYYVDRTV